jgi:HEAT repeat protein
VALAYAQLLGATGLPQVVPMLSALAMHIEPAVRSAAVAGLARIFDPEASRAVIHALNDPQPEVRRAAAHDIAWFGDASLVPLVLVRLQEEEDHEVAAALIGAVGELRDPAAVTVLVEIARGISGVFQRHPANVRLAALRALALIATPEARAAVESHLPDRRPDMRAAAQQALQETA